MHVVQVLTSGRRGGREAEDAGDDDQPTNSGVQCQPPFLRYYTDITWRSNNVQFIADEEDGRFESSILSSLSCCIISILEQPMIRNLSHEQPKTVSSH